MNWKEIEQTILGRLDVKAEYQKLGVEFTGKIRESGYAECKAWGREDNSASACVNVDTGHYKDSGGADREITLWQFAADTGRFENWQLARQYYAQKAGVQYGNEVAGFVAGIPVRPADPHCTFCNKPGHWRPDCPDLVNAAKEEKKVGLVFVADPETENTGGVSTILMNWIRLFKKCTILTRDGLAAAGAVLGTKQYDGKVVDSVIGWESFDNNGDITGAIVVSRTSDKIKVRAGETDDCYAKCQSIGEPGLVGRGGVWNLFKAETAPIILKCEGLSDMLAACSKMPKAYDITDDTPWPVTNKNGASEHPAPYLDMLKRARQVWIIHDRDEPGQKGAEKWAKELHAAGIKVKNVYLPFPLEPKHGKDLRDYFKEFTWSDLMKLCDATPFWEPAIAPPGQPPGQPPAGQLGPEFDPANDNLLDRCQIHVLGQDKDDVVEVYSSFLKRMARIKDLDNIGYVRSIQKFGNVIEQFVKEKAGDEDDPRPSLKVLKLKIAREASRRLLTEANRLGTGVWMENGEIILVNGNSAWHVSRDLDIHCLAVPVFNEKVISLREKDQWFDSQHLIEDLARIKADPTIKERVTQRVFNIFNLWNWKAKDEEHRQMLSNLYTGIVGAMLLQSIWTWRPIITVNGAAESGKTELLNRTKQLLGAISRKVDKPTAAGIRQYCAENSYCMYIDEFEKVKGRQEVFEMFRTFSAGSMTLRGSVSHEAKEWHLKIMPLLASIESGVQAVADDSRRIAFELQSAKRSYGEFVAGIPSPEEWLEIIREFRATVISCAHRALEIEMILRTTQPELNQRRKDSYAAGVAMIAAMRGWDIEYAKQVIRDLVEWVNDQTDVDLKSDEIRLVQIMLDTQLHESHGELVTLREIFNKFCQLAYEPDDDEKRMMDRRGFRVTTFGNVAIHPGRIASVFKGTEFEGMRVKEILMRVKDAKYWPTTWYDSSSAKVVLIPMAEFIKLANPDTTQILVK